MNLYHGTWEDNYENILLDGNLKCSYLSDSTTQELNRLLSKYIGKDIRRNCIYLSIDKECTHAYDRALKVPVSSLDSRLIKICDNRLLDQLLMAYFDGAEEKVLERIAKGYYESMISFEEYMKVREGYDKEHFAECLYFGDIKVNENNVY